MLACLAKSVSESSRGESGTARRAIRVAASDVSRHLGWDSCEDRRPDPRAREVVFLLLRCRQAVRGHCVYYAVPGNTPAIAEFGKQVVRHWHWALNRRSQRT